jgi:hypothetical protein
MLHAYVTPIWNISRSLAVSVVGRRLLGQAF